MEIKKSPKKDLERRRFQLLEIGMIFSLAFVFLAFQYKTADFKDNTLGTISGVDLEDEIIPITVMEQQKPEPPKIKVKIITKIEQVDNNSDLDDNTDDRFWDFMDSDSNLDSLLDISNAEDNIEDNLPLASWQLNEQPSFRGDLMEFYEKNLVYPEMELDNNIEGTVWVGFIVERDGSLTNIKVLRHVSPGLDAEALRVVKKMPKWNSGKQMQKPVRVSFQQPIKFEIAR